jgi:hypothetical protein
MLPSRRASTGIPGGEPFKRPPLIKAGTASALSFAPMPNPKAADAAHTPEHTSRRTSFVPASRRQSTISKSSNPSTRLNKGERASASSDSELSSEEDDDNDDENTVDSALSGVHSAKSRHSDVSRSSGSSVRSSLLFKDRTERNIVKADHSYHYKCQGKGKNEVWSAEFDGPLEEFIYPSLQQFTFKHRAIVPDGQSEALNRLGNKRRGAAPLELEAVRNYHIRFPKWTLTKGEEEEVEKEKDESKFDDELKRGEKFLREGIQRNYRKRIKKEAEQEKKKFVKKSSKAKSRYSILEQSVGLVFGKDSFFLPKPADEVVSEMLLLSRLLFSLT